MNRTRMILSALLLLGVLLVSTACSTSYRVMHIEDHPAGTATLMETHTTTHMLAGLYNTSHYDYWECDRSDAGLDCHKVCYNHDQFGNFPAGVTAEDLACTQFGAVAE